MIHSIGDDIILVETLKWRAILMAPYCSATAILAVSVYSPIHKLRVTCVQISF